MLKFYLDSNMKTWIYTFSLHNIPNSSNMYKYVLYSRCHHDAFLPGGAKRNTFLDMNNFQTFVVKIRREAGRKGK